MTNPMPRRNPHIPRSPTRSDRKGVRGSLEDSSSPQPDCTKNAGEPVYHRRSQHHHTGHYFHGCVLSNLSIDSRRVISSIGMAVLAMLNLSVKREWSGHHRWSEKKPKEKHRGGPDLCQGYHLWTNSGNWPTNWPWTEGRENGPKT